MGKSCRSGHEGKDVQLGFGEAECGHGVSRLCSLPSPSVAQPEVGSAAHPGCSGPLHGPFAAALQIPSRREVAIQGMSRRWPPCWIFWLSWVGVALSSWLLLLASAKINLHHPWIRLHLIHGALTEHLALVEHGHPGLQAADELHVVLNDQDRMLSRQGPE